jgi:hypothetical protein
MTWKAVEEGIAWGIVLACLFLAGHFAWHQFFPG